MLYVPPEIPTLPTSILTARYRLHDAVKSRCDSFQWLVDSHHALGSEELSRPHDLHHPDCRIIRLNADGQLIVSVTSMRRAISYDSTTYRGSYKSWISTVAQFYPLNPTRSYRLVSYYIFGLLSFNLYYSTITLYWPSVA